MVHHESARLGGGGRPVDAAYSRSPVYGRRGIAATAQPLASQVAVDTLKRGGSAVDAAIAANAALALMEPTGCGLGGDIFFLVWDPESAALHGYNGSGRAPAGRGLAELKAALEALRADGRLSADEQGIPAYGSLPVTVPGVVDGWYAAHERFGVLPMSEVLAPAIAYAEEGFPVSPVIASCFAQDLLAFECHQALIEEFDNARATWFASGRAPLAGEMLRNPDLARTLQVLAKGGRDAFYTGPLAEAIDAYCRRVGCALRLADLSEHSGEWVQPGQVNYRGYDVFELPPNGQGFAALQMLSILKNVDLERWPRGSAEVIHYLVEAKRLAFEDVARFYADPAFTSAPLNALLSDDYGEDRFARINPEQASPAFEHGEPRLEAEGDTTYLTVADERGMMVSLIQSNYAGMGCGLVPDGLGFMLQNRGRLFALDSHHLNAYAPGKRPFHTIIPAFVMRDGKPFMSFGLMGASMQPQGHVQVLVNMIDYGMNVQQAGDAARVFHVGGSEPTGIEGDALGTLSVEPGIPRATREQLRDMGHRVEIVDDGVRFGGYQAIQVLPGGVYAGATEMRKDGTVAAY